MTWVFILSMATLAAAIIIIEIRAVREDESRQHAPGFALVMGGLVMIALGIAASIESTGASPLLASFAGLATVTFGATRHRETAAG
jgi:hypothetical protein